MKQLLFACMVLVLAASCKKPASKPVTPPTSQIDGVLAYRASCQGGATAPFPGRHFDGGPVLYLTDANNQVRGGYVKPDAQGRFSLSGVSPGEYRLRLAAGNLRSFWVGFPVTGVRVVAPNEAKRIHLGTVCADTMPPAVTEVRASWNEHDESRAVAGRTVHLEAAAGQARLSAWAEVGGALRELAAEWQLTGEGTPISVSGAVATWTPGAVTQASLLAWVGDGMGSFAQVTSPLRLHGQRAEGKRVGGWLSFADSATLAAFDVVADGAMVDTGAAGARFSAPSSTDRAEASLASRASYLASELAVAAVLELSRLDAGAEVELSLDGPFSTWVSARLRATDAGGVLELVDATGAVTAAAPWQPTPSALIQLTVEPASGAITLTIGEFVPTQTLTAVVAPGSAERLAPRLTVRRMGATPTAAAFDVSCEGLYVSEEVWVYSLPITPGTHEGIVYDAFVHGSEPTAIALIEAGVYFGIGEQLVSIGDPRPISAYLVELEGRRTTLVTDQPAEVWGPQVSAIDAVDLERMAPINGGSAMLY